MSKIRRLSEHTINQIAAGEVIERPASVVKELVENSIDAGAKRIEVDVVEGGKKLVKVTDNGRGIAAGEMELAFEKHTTSKIHGIEDVYSLGTLGFRGEALASIASVSRVEMLSRNAADAGDAHDAATGDGTGRRILVSGGRLVYNESEQAPVGTTVKVMDIFFNLPARKKYQKKASTELKHIITVITGQAIINPGVHFILKNNQRTALNYPAAEDERENLFHIFGADTARELIPVGASAGPVRVRGFVAPPSLSRATRSGQWFFVNGRMVTSDVVREALEDAYKGALMRNRHPFAVLSLRVDPEQLDVNVHPTKREVRFASDHGVYAAVFEAVGSALGRGEDGGKTVGTGPLHGRLNDGRDEMDRPRVDGGPVLRKSEPDPESCGRKGFQTTLMEESAGSSRPVDGGGTYHGTSVHGGGREPSFVKAWRESADRLGLPLMEPLAQVHDLYIVAQGRDGLVLVDQHALHERIMLERVTRQYRERSTAVQELIIPMDLELGPSQSTVFGQWKGNLERMGFGVEHFGGDRYVVRYIPASIKLREAKRLIMDIIDRLAEGGQGVSLEDMEEEILKMTACRSAIKAGQPLDRKAMEQLFREMYEAENPLYCAHGRPTMIRLTLRELERKFKRKV